jgi:hypothetical protein
MAHITSSAALQTNLLAGGSHTIAPGAYTLPASALTLQVAGSLVATGPGVFISAGNSISSWTNNGDGSWSGTNTTTGMVWGYRDPTINDVFEVARSPKRNGTDLLDRTTAFYLAQDQTPSIRTDFGFDSLWPTATVLPQNTSVPQVDQWVKIVSGARGRLGGRVTKITAKSATTGVLTLSAVVDDGWGPSAYGETAHIVYMNDLSFLTAAGEYHHNESTGAVRIRPFGTSAFSTTKTVWAAGRRTSPIILESAWTFTDLTFCDQAMDPDGPEPSDHFFQVTSAGCTFSRCSFINVGAAISAIVPVTIQGGTHTKCFDSSCISLFSGSDASLVEGVTFMRPQLYANYGGAVVDVRAPFCTVRACDFRYVPRHAVFVNEEAENSTSIEYNIFDEYGATFGTGAVYTVRTTTSAYAAPATRPQVVNNYFRNGYGAQQFTTITGGSPANTLYTPYACSGVYLDSGASHWRVNNNIFENIGMFALHIDRGANIEFQHNLIFQITSNNDYELPWQTARTGLGSAYSFIRYNSAYATATPAIAASSTFFRWNGLHGNTQPIYYLGSATAGQTISQNVTQHASRDANDINGDPLIIRNQGGWIIGVSSNSLLKTTSGIGWSDPPVSQMGPEGWGFSGRVVQDSVTTGTSSNPNGLTYHPDSVCPLVNQTLRNIGASGTGTSGITLLNNEHTVITLNGGTSPVTGVVKIIGNGTQRVRIIGGQIKLSTVSTAASSDANRILILDNLAIVYLEGLLLDRDRQSGSGLILRGRGVMRVYLQNSRIQNIGYEDGGGSCGSSIVQHGDWCHIQTQIHSVFTDKVTAHVQHTGFLMSGAAAFADNPLSGPAVRGELNFKRTNTRIFDSSLARNGWGSCWSGSAAMWLYSPCTAPTYPVKLDDVWVNDDDDTGRRSILQMIVPSGPSGTSTTTCGFTVSGDSFTGTADPPTSLINAGWTGSIRGGIPATGDFVSSGFTGLNYQSPGYTTGGSGAQTTTYFENHFASARGAADVSVLKISAATAPRTFTLTVQATARSTPLVQMRATDTTFVAAPLEASTSVAVFRTLNPPTDPDLDPPPPSPSGQPELLTWNPDIVCRLTNPTTENVPTTGYPTGFALTAGAHYRFVMPSSVVTGRLYIRGVEGSGNRIQIIGGSVRNTTENATNESACVLIQGVDLAYLEGIKADKADTAGDCFIFRGANGIGGTLYLQNCLAVGANYRNVSLGHSFSQHGDGLQVQSQITGLFIDKFTIYSWGQGYLINSSYQNQYALGSSILNGAVLRRMNVHLYDRANNPITENTNNPRHCFYLQDDCSALPIPYTLDAYTADNCYAIDDDPNGDSLLALVAPGTDNAPTCTGTLDESAPFASVYWSDDRQIRGRVYYGVPPGGDYVNTSTFTGLNYTTPGYATVPGDTPPDTATFNYGSLNLTYDSAPTIKQVMDDAARSQGWAVPDPNNPDWVQDFPHTANPPRGVGYSDRWYDFPNQLVDRGAIPRFLWWNDRGFTPVTITVGQAAITTALLAPATAVGVASVPTKVTRAASTPVTHARAAAAQARGGVAPVTFIVQRASVRTLISAHARAVGATNVITTHIDNKFTTSLLFKSIGRGVTSVFQTKIGPGTTPGEAVTGAYAGSSMQGLRVGGSNRDLVSFRFKAKHTGNIDRLTFLHRFASAVGTGGDIRISIRPNEVTPEPLASPARFMATTGSDSNAGTITAPWLTLSASLPKLAAGETLYIRGGTYIQPRFTVSGVVGTASARITVKNYPGETAIFDGGAGEFRTIGNSDWEVADATIGLYRSVSTGFSSYTNAAASFRDPATGKWIRLGPYSAGAVGEQCIKATSDVPTLDVAGDPNYYAGPGVWKGGDGRIYIRLTRVSNSTMWDDTANIARIIWPQSTDPRQVEIAVTDRIGATGAIRFGSTVSRYLTFEGLEWRHYGYHCFFLENGSNNLIFKNLRVLATGGHGFRFGSSSITDVLLDGITYAPEIPLWVSWNDIHSAGPMDGLEHVFYTLGSSINRLEVKNCRVHGAWEFSVNGQVSDDVHLHHNYSLHWDDFTQQNVGSTNFHIHHNIIHGPGPSYQGSSDQAADPETVWIHHNIIDNRFVKLHNKQGATFGVDVPDYWRCGTLFPRHTIGSDDSSAWKIYNNHLIWGDRAHETGDAGLAHVANPIPGKPKEVLNNIIVNLDQGSQGGSPHTVRGAHVHDGSAIFDGNGYYRTAAYNDMFRLWENASTTRSFATLAAFNADSFFTESKTNYAPGWENSGIEQDPLIPAVTSGISTSPALYIASSTVVNGGVALATLHPTWPGVDGTYRGAISTTADGSDIGPQTAQSNVPSEDILAETTITSAAQAPYNTSLVQVTFSRPAHVTKGLLYQIAFENVHADKLNNYTFIDALFYSKETPPHPKIPVEDSAILSGNDLDPLTGMTVQTGYQPVFNAFYLDGRAQGNPYRDVLVWLGSAAGFNGIVSGTQKVRQTFQFDTQTTISELWLRYGRVSGSDSLSCRISELVPSSTPGETPAYSSAITTGGSSTLPNTHSVTLPTELAAGDLIIIACVLRNDEANGSATINEVGWTEFPGNPYGTHKARLALFYKISDGTESGSVSITGAGGTTNDLFYGHAFRFTASDGFAASPIEAIAIAGGSGTPLNAPTVTPTAANRLAVFIAGTSLQQSSIGSVTGETGGDWVQQYRLATQVGGDGTVCLQTSDQSSGGAISGGSVEFTVNPTAEWTAVGFALVPAVLFDDDTEVETVTFTASESALENDSSAYGTESHRWVRKTLSSPRVLAPSTTYAATLTAPATSQYRVYPLQDAAADSSLFSQTSGVNGRAEYSTDNGSSYRGWKYLSVDNRDDADLQFFLVLTNPATSRAMVDARAEAVGNVQVFPSPQLEPQQHFRTVSAVAAGLAAAPFRAFIRAPQNTVLTFELDAVGVATSGQDVTRATPTVKTHQLSAAVSAVGDPDVLAGNRMTRRVAAVGVPNVIQQITIRPAPQTTQIDVPLVSGVGVPSESRLFTRHEPNTLILPPIAATAVGNVSGSSLKASTTTRLTVPAAARGVARVRLSEHELAEATAVGVPSAFPIWIHPPTLVVQTSPRATAVGMPDVRVQKILDTVQSVTTLGPATATAVGVPLVTPQIRLTPVPTTTQLTERAVAVGRPHTVQTKLTNIPPGADPERTWPPRSRRHWNKRYWWMGA